MKNKFKISSTFSFGKKIFFKFFLFSITIGCFFSFYLINFSEYRKNKLTKNETKELIKIKNQVLDHLHYFKENCYEQTVVNIDSQNELIYKKMEKFKNNNLLSLENKTFLDEYSLCYAVNFFLKSYCYDKLGLINKRDNEYKKAQYYMLKNITSSNNFSENSENVKFLTNYLVDYDDLDKVEWNEFKLMKKLYMNEDN